jgi:hypothetical protein
MLLVAMALVGKRGLSSHSQRAVVSLPKGQLFRVAGHGPCGQIDTEAHNQHSCLLPSSPRPRHQGRAIISDHYWFIKHLRNLIALDHPRQNVARPLALEHATRPDFRPRAHTYTRKMSSAIAGGVMLLYGTC